MRNSHRSRQAGRPDAERQVAGVGEFRAVAERLLETGAQYLEQGREWLHQATRRQEGGDPSQRRGEAAFDDDHRGARYARHTERARDQQGHDRPYAPDEYSFSETGGVFDRRGGRQDQGPGAHGFEADLDDPLHRRARPAGARQHSHDHRSQAGAGWRGRDDDDFIPGSYGFGGEGRHQPGDLPDDAGAGGTSGRWERAYRDQGRASYRGRGPRGYVRSDQRILEDVHERLCDDPIVDATDIEVHCDQGHVILSGRVPMRWMKHRAEDIVDSLPGVKDIDNRIRVSAEEPVAQGDFDTSRTTGAGFDTSGSKQDPDRAVAARGARSAEKKEPGAGQNDSTGSTPKSPQAH